VTDRKGVEGGSSAKHVKQTILQRLISKFLTILNLFQHWLGTKAIDELKLAFWGALVLLGFYRGMSFLLWLHVVEFWRIAIYM